MKNIAITTLLWILLLLLTSEAIRLVYNSIYLPIFDPVTNDYDFGNSNKDLYMLLSTAIIFIVAGAILSWRMKGKTTAIISSMTLGVLALSIDIAIRVPWFQIMPSHPVLYDFILAFVGASIPPLSCACGAYFYSIIKAKYV